MNNMIKFLNADALHMYLLDLNYERGIAPEVSGYDSWNRPIVVWLIETAGDDVWPLAAYVGGPIAERPDVVRVEFAELSYPVSITEHPDAEELDNSAIKCGSYCCVRDALFRVELLSDHDDEPGSGVSFRCADHVAVWLRFNALSGSIKVDML